MSDVWQQGLVDTVVREATVRVISRTAEDERTMTLEKKSGPMTYSNEGLLLPVRGLLPSQSPPCRLSQRAVSSGARA